MGPDHSWDDPSRLSPVEVVTSFKTVCHNKIFPSNNLPVDLFVKFTDEKTNNIRC